MDYTPAEKERMFRRAEAQEKAERATLLSGKCKVGFLTRIRQILNFKIPQPVKHPKVLELVNMLRKNTVPTRLGMLQSLTNSHQLPPMGAQEHKRVWALALEGLTRRQLRKLRINARPKLIRLRAARA